MSVIKHILTTLHEENMKLYIYIIVLLILGITSAERLKRDLSTDLVNEFRDIADPVKDFVDGFRIFLALCLD